MSARNGWSDSSGQPTAAPHSANSTRASPPLASRAAARGLGAFRPVTRNLSGEGGLEVGEIAQVHVGVAVEVETGKSDIKENLAKLREKGFDRVVVVATSPAAVTVCHNAINDRAGDSRWPVELMTWFNVG